MNRIKSRPVALLIVVLLLALMGCSTKSPTEPSTGGNGGSTPPPSGDATIVLTASNPSPVRGSSSVVSAAVTIGGQAAVNGTAVEFSTNFGTFTETGTDTALRTTVGGVATVTITSANVGVAQVTARIGTVSRTVNVTFRDDVGPVSDAPTIVAVTPPSGSPAGNQAITITGTHFKSPVRVFFGAKEAVVLSATETEIRVLSPAVNLGASEQSLSVDVKVITKAGASDETSVTLAGGFRYEREILAPIFNGLSPVSGPNEGNTRITIVGEGFQSPCRVFFGTSGSAGGSLVDQVELEVVTVSFGQIVAITPPAVGLASELRDKQVAMRIQNVASNKDIVIQSAFRYGPKIQVIAAAPTVGSTNGGTRVTINGYGFEDPVAVSLAGVPAQIIRVSGTEIVCVSSAPILTSCAAPAPGPVTVTNINTGATGDGPDFTYVLLKPDFIDASSGAVEGGSVTTRVIHAGNGPWRFTIGDSSTGVAASNVTRSSYDADTDISTFTFTIPIGVLTFTTEACDAGGGIAGTRNKTTVFPLNWTTLDGSTCAATLNGFAVTPNNGLCTTTAPPTPSASPASIDFGSVVAAGAVFADSSGAKICNTGGGVVALGSTSFTGPNSGDFSLSVGLSQFSLATGQCATYTIRFDPGAAGARTGTFNVSAGATTVTVALTGNGT